MKKGIVLLLLCSLLTACGNPKQVAKVCTLETKQQINEFLMHAEGDSITDFTVKVTMPYDNWDFDYDDVQKINEKEKNQILKQATSILRSQIKKGEIKVTFEKEGIIGLITGTKQDLKDMKFSSSLQKNIKSLESSNYVCKDVEVTQK